MTLDIRDRDVLVVGLARSGVAAARLLAQRGARVVATDAKAERQLGPVPDELREHGVRLELGGHRPESFVSPALVVVSPGVPWNLDELKRARSAGVPVIAEIELASRLVEGTVVAVTGTKGKSTTVAVLGEMLREADREVRVGGNIGNALSELIEGATLSTTFVIEASSFQLEGTDAFHPHVALFLNLSPDHIDRHGDQASYSRAKERIFRNQTSDDWAVVNADDPSVLELARRGRARLLPFSMEERSGDGAFFEAGQARLRLDGEMQPLFQEASIRLIGRHLAADVLAAGAAARLLGAPCEALERAVRGFSGLEHVLEYVASVGGVDFYNDSKATNVGAAKRALEAFDRPIVAILGGRSKNADFTLLRPAARRAKAVIAYGEARDEIQTALAGEVAVESCERLEDAVVRARERAARGDVVVLAPACASFDQFRDFAERGRAFRESVLAHLEATS